MTVAIVLAICCLLVSVVTSCHLSRHRPRRETASGAAASTGVQPPTHSLRSTAHPRHRWSGPRARLELTEEGLRGSGSQVRFCLDCADVRTEDHPLNEMEPK